MTIYTSPLGSISVPALLITDLVLQGLAQSADRVVLKCEVTGHSLTGAALADRIRRFAGGLQARGIGPGQVVAIIAGNTPEFATVFHGVAFAGATLTTVNPTYTAPELHHQLVDSGACLLVVPQALLSLAHDAAKGTAVTQIVSLDATGEVPSLDGTGEVPSLDGTGEVPSLDDLMGPALATQVPVDLAHHVVVLPYSSGTTGLPKGVQLSHRNLVANVVQVQAMIGVAPGDVTLAILPFFHIYGMQVLMNMYLSMGAGLVVQSRHLMDRI